MIFISFLLKLSLAEVDIYELEFLCQAYASASQNQGSRILYPHVLN